ncbi:hypothetical protein NF700_06865 [Sphingomonadaceae bacterium OTU29MARTA1]|nr:hypothetical protein NF700_06865 [Sphingomonadaceae bacterium OTU29MARTA1]
MGLMHPVPRGGHRTGSPWPRRLRRQWSRRDDAASVAQLLTMIPSLPRAELSRLTERLIDRMDVLDADPDLEPEEDVDLSGDDGCGVVQRCGRTFWGAAEDDEGRDHVPIYGEDQSAGPLWDRFSGYRWYKQEKTYE